VTAPSRMLALTTDAFGGRGGIAQYNRDLLQALARSGSIRSIIVMVRHAPNVVSTPAGVEQLGARRGRVAYILTALCAVIFRRFDVVYCGHLYMAPLGWLITRFWNATFIVQTHGIEVWNPPSRLRRAAVEHADLVLCVSRHTRAAVLNWAAIEPEKAVILAPTVGEAFTPGDAPHLRTTWNLGGRRVLLSVGRMDAREAYKGNDRVIATIAPLVARGHDVVFVAIGEGDDIGRLKALAAEAGVADRVQFRRAEGQAALVEAYRMADLFVMPSTGEGFGIVYLEAMACGTPAIGLAVGGASDPLGDGELGIVARGEELSSVIDQHLRAPKVDTRALSAKVTRRFGGNCFQARVDQLMASLPRRTERSAGRRHGQA
jgi:phosphatidyl-myo-inositol dimannoside synthase